ncbi:MAG: hypothetical protein ACREGH_03165 [Minisyncoccia bacterium]
MNTLLKRNALRAAIVGGTSLAMLISAGALMANAQTSSATGMYGTTGAPPTTTRANDTYATNTTTNPATTGTGTAQRSGTTATGTGATTGRTGTPGVPNTGAGGDAAMNLALLVVSGFAAVAAAAYLARRRIVLG